MDKTIKIIAVSAAILVAVITALTMKIGPCSPELESLLNSHA